jgi:hypothetical protein
MTSTSHPEGAGLLIRLWVEPGAPADVRARLMTFCGTDEPSAFAAAGEEETVVRLLSEWVHDQLDALRRGGSNELVSGGDGTTP